MPFEFWEQERAKLLAMNDGVLTSARHTLEQNGRMIDMIDELLVQIDKIKIIIKDPVDYSGSAICEKIKCVLNP